MKKLFYFYALLLCFAACDNEENNTESGNLDPATELSGIISDLGNYDVNSAVTLLSLADGWVREYKFEYTEGWHNIFQDYTQADNGGTTYRYKFIADGKLEDFTKPSIPPFDIELPKVRTWAFDPEIRTLTIDGALSYHLIALGEDAFIWDYVDTWSSDHPRYFREVFKAKAIE